MLFISKNGFIVNFYVLKIIMEIHANDKLIQNNILLFLYIKLTREKKTNKSIT